MSDDGPAPSESMAQFGKRLFTQHGCVACHGREDGVGPALAGVFGSERAFVDGSRAVADEAYVIESIVDPNVKVVEGYAPVQPSYDGMLSVTHLEALVAYIRCMGDAPSTADTCAGL
jgi:cytochrome c oxidase subunit II